MVFYRKVGGKIPDDLPELKLIKYDPIFFVSEMITVSSKIKDYNFFLKIIGEGSYAKVFKYKDDFYDKYFVLKRAKNDLDKKIGKI